MIFLNWIWRRRWGVPPVPIPPPSTDRTLVGQFVAIETRPVVRWLTPGSWVSWLTPQVIVTQPITDLQSAQCFVFAIPPTLAPPVANGRPS